MCLDCKKEVEEAVNKIILSLYKKNWHYERAVLSEF
jgi:hypothetical protein